MCTLLKLHVTSYSVELLAALKICNRSCSEESINIVRILLTSLCFKYVFSFNDYFVDSSIVFPWRRHFKRLTNVLHFRTIEARKSHDKYLVPEKIRAILIGSAQRGSVRQVCKVKLKFSKHGRLMGEAAWDRNSLEWNQCCENYREIWYFCMISHCIVL